MSAYIAKAVRQEVMEWARYRCCYCQTEQRVSGAQMHIEHIIPLAKGGTSEPSNLCLSCAWCNSFKGANTHALDPDDQQWVSLFNPRQQLWGAHFQWHEDGIYIACGDYVGRTGNGGFVANE